MFSSSARQFTIYVNGVSQALTNVTAGAMPSFSYPAGAQYSIAQIGRYPASSTGVSAGGYFPGYISNLRITKQALYSGTFIPSFVPLQTTQSAGTNIAAISTPVALLTCSSPTIVDNSAVPLSMTNPASVVATTTDIYAKVPSIARREYATGVIEIAGQLDDYTDTGDV